MQAIGTSGIWLSDSPSLLKFHAASTSLMLASGGDRRIFPDPVSGRNRYGTLVKPADAEISFSSTTASNVSQQGFDAAAQALARLIDPDPVAAESLVTWFGDIRGRISRAIGADDCRVLLAASGTDIELIALGIMQGLSARPITNIVIAPDETGSGVPRAAAGRHYSDLSALGQEVIAGAAIAGMAVDRIETVNVFIRDEMGRPRGAKAIDEDAIAIAEQALRQGRDVLLHVLDTSKTGLPGVSRAAARHVLGLEAGRVQVIVDACQFRCAPDQLRRDIEDGFMVAVTGSKFLAGPPFAGALALPGALAAALVEEAASGRGFPDGLAGYCAGQDWPAALREKMHLPFAQEANVGLGLRWIAALCHLDGLQGMAEEQDAAVRAGILSLMREGVERSARLFIHRDDDGERIAASGILPFSILNGERQPMSFDEARKLQIALREDAGGPVCHIGQAVQLGERAVLRLSLSAPDLAVAATQIKHGRSVEQAIQPVAERLQAVFGKLEHLLSA